MCVCVRISSRMRRENVLLKRKFPIPSVGESASASGWLDRTSNFHTQFSSPPPLPSPDSLRLRQRDVTRDVTPRRLAAPTVKPHLKEGRKWAICTDQSLWNKKKYIYYFLSVVTKQTVTVYSTALLSLMELYIN